MSQETFESKEWGTLTFYPVKDDHSFKSRTKCCNHCMLEMNGEECVQANCRPAEREDYRLGYYSIHQMPKEKKNSTNK